MTKVTVYGTATCPYCITLKEFLDDNKIAYDHYDVSQNPIAAQNMARLTDQMVVPFSVVELDDGTTHKITGHDEAKFKELLKF